MALENNAQVAHQETKCAQDTTAVTDTTINSPIGKNDDYTGDALMTQKNDVFHNDDKTTFTLKKKAFESAAAPSVQCVS